MESSYIYFIIFKDDKLKVCFISIFIKFILKYCVYIVLRTFE